MANSIARVPVYRGNMIASKLAVKQNERKMYREWKRNLLKVWDLRKVKLWQGGYVNNDIREALGFEENFLTSTKDLKWFGVELKPDINAEAFVNISEADKEYLIDKCISVFNTYGKTIETAFVDRNTYDYKIYKDGLETSFDGAEDEQLATLLYGRLLMYMVDNDSTDTTDKWSDVNPNDFDYWTSYTETVTNEDGTVESVDARSKLKYFTYTFTNDDIRKVVNDRLFTIRTYTTYVASSSMTWSSEDDGYVSAKTIDLELANELLDNSDYEAQVLNNNTLVKWNGSAYEINYSAVMELPPREFFVFITTHLATFHKVDKKWYQSGFFGFIVVVVVLVIAVVTQQYWIATYGVSAGTVFIVAGLILSISGALLGNEVMVTGGQIIALAGGMMNISQAYSSGLATIESQSATLLDVGAEFGIEQATVEAFREMATTELLTTTLMSVGKFAYNTYSTFANNNEATPIEEAQTPEEELNYIYVAEDEAWDYVRQQMPDMVIQKTMKLM